MLDSSTIEMLDDWKKKEQLEAHNDLEELTKPDELNELIMTKVNLLLEKVPRQCDAAEVRDDIADLIQLLRIRNLKKELKHRQVGLRM